jgi:ferric-dicitrate binding protein FerR (iron transport regulator)
MKEMKKIKKLTGKEWNDLASLFSDEKTVPDAPLKDAMMETEKQWKELRGMDNNKIDVDKAWSNVYSRILDNEIKPEQKHLKVTYRKTFLLRIAAAVVILLGIGTLLVLNKDQFFSGKTIIQAGTEQRNFQIDLPDGSHVYLNRNSRLSYKPDFGKETRKVKLTGEAFFEIAPNARKPFIIDAGKADVQVVGTSFNVLTENKDSEVEVFVKTGIVKLSDKSGQQSIILDPGFIGRMNSEISEKQVNEDPNYLAWNTDRLVYKGEKLEKVFDDLRKYFNLDVVADDSSILALPWTSPIYYESRDNVISLICISFNLSYTKDGDVYHLYKK